MKLFCKREIQGAISLFLVAIMLPMMVISGLMVDTARYQLAKSMVASAGDLALNGALADYDAILKDVYGLFAMSQVDDVAKNVKEYFEQTVVSYGVVGEEDAGEYVSELLGKVYEYLLVEDKEMADFLDMAVEDSKVKAEKVADSSLANPQVLEKQIVEYMKYRAPVDFGLSFLDSLSAFTKVEAQTGVVQAQVNAQSSLQDAADKNYALYQAVRAYDEEYNVLEPDPALDRKHLKNYGHIFTVEYVEEYEKLHRMTMIFCSAAYLGKWELPDSGRSTEAFFLLSDGEYIVQEGDQLKAARHLPDTNQNFGQASSSPRGFVDEFLKNDWQDVERILNGYGGRKIGDPSLNLEEEANWGQAIADFQKVDSFYKENWEEYADKIKKLDGFAAAMEAYLSRIKDEIDDLKQKKKDAENAEEKANEQIGKLLSADAEAAERLGNNTQQEREDAESYRKNAEELEELENLPLADRQAAGGRINSLREQNQMLRDSYEKDGTNVLDQVVSDLETRKTCEEQIGELNRNVEEAKQQKESHEKGIKEKEEERDEKQKEYQNVLEKCRGEVNFFNEDARSYKTYKENIKSVISGRTQKVAEEFQELYGNVKHLEELLAQVEKKFVQAEGAIHTYTENVETWSGANDAYAGGGPDNFSDVQSAGIREAENVFSEDEVQEFLGKVKERHEKLTIFLEELDANFVYMGREKIRDIMSAQQIANVIGQSGEGSAIASKYVEQKAQASMADCDGCFRLTHDMDSGRLDKLEKLTEPVPCCAFMNYLHQTYQEQYELNKTNSEKQLGQEEKEGKDAYDEVKKSDDINKDIHESMDASRRDLGYQYQKVNSIGGSGYPSGENSSSGGTEEKSGKADKDGLEASRSSASSMLGGLGKAMENGRDKLYVMAYLFDNFSYNTIVQDRVREDGGEESKKLSWTHCGQEVYGSYVDSVKCPAAYTKGEYQAYPINALNNKIYGAEIEYVLYGSRSPSANVDYTYASIYAVRVLFNAVYAFTASDIRNQTRAVAIAVQAATCGLVPYQVVQVVMQLALAMGESAIDLKNMEAGAKVAVVKSKETWTLSMEGLKNLTKATVEAVMDSAAKKTTKLVQSKIDEIVDIGAEKLSECVTDMESDLTKIAGSAAEEILDNVFARIDAVVDEVMNQVLDELFYSEDGLLKIEDPEKMAEQIRVAFSGARNQIVSRIGSVMDDMSQGTDNPLLSASCEAAADLVDKALKELQEELFEELQGVVRAVDLRSVAYRQIYAVKLKISQKVEAESRELISGVSGKVQYKINETANKIKDSAKEKTEEAREKVTKEINEFVDGISLGSTKMDTGSLSKVNDNAVGSSTKASAIAFGYSDYLRLFLFIGLCADNQSGTMISRIGDLIQLNLSSAPEGSPLHHGSGGSFSMANAMTYMSLEAEVDLDLIFLNLGIFKKQVESFNQEYQEEDQIDLGETMGIRYLGIVGY